MPQPPQKEPSARAVPPPAHGASLLRVWGVVGCLIFWAAAVLLLGWMASSVPSIITGLAGAGFALSMMRIARAVDRQATRADLLTAQETLRPPPLARVFARLFGSAGAHALTPTLALLSTGCQLFVLAVLADLFTGRRPVTESVIMVSASAVAMTLLFLLARRTALWGARQAALAAQERETIQRAATAREQQGGALSLDVSGGATGGLTQLHQDANTETAFALDARAGELDAAPVQRAQVSAPSSSTGHTS